MAELDSSWLNASFSTLARPFLVLTIALLSYNLPTLIHKVKLTFQGVQYFIFCHDKSWKKPQDPLTYFNDKDTSNYEKKRIIFVRHGESTWNETFNKGPHRGRLQFAVVFLPNLIKALLYEFYLLITGRMDSWFTDAPLSHYGLSQVSELGIFLSRPPSTPPSSEQKWISILNADPGAPTSQLCSSNLRRALSTVAASFRSRLSRQLDGDSILVVPSLQEISRNPDTLSITPPHTPVTASWIDRESSICDFQSIFSKQTDMSLHIGNKPLDTNGLKRMESFCDFAFHAKKDVLIIGGHSIWFRSFFRTYLPYGKKHVSKEKKMVNAGTVAFMLMKVGTPQGDKFLIDPTSIEVVFGGFK